MTRGANLRFPRPDRERRVEGRVWLTRRLTSAQIGAILQHVVDYEPSMEAVPYLALPGARGLEKCRYRITRQQRGVVELMASIRGCSLSEALRGICAGAEGE